LKGKIVGRHEKVVKEETIDLWLFFQGRERVLPQRRNRSATIPLGIVYFLLTPQEQERKIPATFPIVFGQGN
jgi:hypothetical protein